MHGREIPDLEEQLREVEAERSRLLDALKMQKAEARQQDRSALALDVRPYPATAEDRVVLFRNMFGDRTDVYARRWENTRTGSKGYSPVCEVIWEDGRRLKASEIFQRFGPRKFAPLTPSVIEAHLRGELVVGVYAIRPDNTCIFLAADFDGEGWARDAAAYRDACSRLGIDCLVEISRSGNGAHVWTLFSEPVPASLARRLGSLLLAKAAAQNPTLKLDAYDRFFPNQDHLPKGGFGNLIALPLQKERRALGFTEFVDRDLKPLPDPWKALSEVKRLTREDVQLILEQNLAAEMDPDLDSLDFEEQVREALQEDVLELPRLPDWKAFLTDKLIIPTSELSEPMVARLKSLAMFPNPVFFEKQRQRFSTYNIPRYIFSGEIHADRIVLPRGCKEAAVELFAGCGSRLEIEDRRLRPKRIQVSFKGTLRQSQKAALDEVSPHEQGVLVAPPGTGKTVMACALIARRKTPTLIIVNRQALLDQWKERLQEFLGLSRKEIGQFTGSRKKPTHHIDVAMIQTLANLDDPKAFFRNYGAVIIDECHHVPAVTLEAVLKECGAPFITGLTATPQRKDRLEPLLFQQCGPIRYVLEDPDAGKLHKELLLRTTRFNPASEDGKPLPLHLIWKQLVEDEHRNQQIADDVVEAINQQRVPIVLSDRIDHLSTLRNFAAAAFPGEENGLPIVEGSLSSRQRTEAIESFTTAIEGKRPACLFATSALLGEGFDLPMLDTLFLAMPISFKGRLIQYAGRLHRPCPGKANAIVYDYLDEQVPLTYSMYRKRLPAYRQMGYEIHSASEEGLELEGANLV